MSAIAQLKDIVEDEAAAMQSSRTSPVHAYQPSKRESTSSTSSSGRS
ncbi:hypothetical protein AB0H92_02475 [Streptomyces phaeochromogenes]